MLFGKKKKQPPFVTAIIPAAGSSRRMGGGNKLLMELDGVPVLGRTLLALEASPQAEYLAVHDGARPLVTPEVVQCACEGAFLHTCAAAGVAVHDTIKEIEKDGHIARTVDREMLRAMQTPQVADKALLTAALQSAIEAGVTVTDECAALVCHKNPKKCHSS